MEHVGDTDGQRRRAAGAVQYRRFADIFRRLQDLLREITKPQELTVAAAWTLLSAARRSSPRFHRPFHAGSA
jgi:hypothetical protein